MTFMICLEFILILHLRAVVLQWDVKTSISLPDIGDVEDTIQGKQDTINDGD